MSDFSIEVIDQPDDTINAELLELTRACPMAGNISIVIERDPDFFALLAAKGKYRVLVARSNGRVIGTFAVVIKEVYLHGKPQKTGYLCDLKIHPDFRDGTVAFRLMKSMAVELKSLSLNTIFCVIANGNLKVEKLLLGRAGMPAGVKAAHFQVFQLLPKKRPPSTYEIVEYSHNQAQQPLELLNNYYQKYNFSTILNEDKSIIGDRAWGIAEGETPKAFLSVIDMKQQKQNRVIKIPLYIKAALAVTKLFWPKMKTPKEGDAISILNIQYLAHAPGYEQQAMALVQQARHYAYQQGFTFLSYGMDSRNILARSFDKLPKVTFDSLGYVINLEGQVWDDSELCHDHFHLV